MGINTYKTHLLVSLVILAAVGAVPAGLLAVQGTGSDIDGTWFGHLPVGNSEEFRLAIEITDRTDGTQKATVISLDQEGTGKLFHVRRSGEQVTLRTQGITIREQMTGNSQIKATWIQGSANIPFTLKHVNEVPGFKRPQAPKPPFPYLQEEVTFTNRMAGVTLAGTLTVPQSGGPYPAVVLISGSGEQDRDELIYYHRPFLVLADYLSQRGIAVLRYDERGVGESSGQFSTATTVDHLKTKKPRGTSVRHRALKTSHNVRYLDCLSALSTIRSSFSPLCWAPRGKRTSTPSRPNSPATFG